MNQKKVNIIYLDAGESSRFGGESKLKHTFLHNFNQENQFTFVRYVVTTEDRLKFFYNNPEFKGIDYNIVLVDKGKGSAHALKQAWDKIDKTNPLILIWGDAYIQKEAVKSLIKSYSEQYFNILLTHEENPYTSFDVNDQGIVTNIYKDHEPGYQDLSMFMFSGKQFEEHKDLSNDFMELLVNKTKATIVNYPIRYFNTKDELKSLKTWTETAGRS